MIVPFGIVHTHLLEEGLLAKMVRLYHLLCGVFTLHCIIFQY